MNETIQLPVVHILAIESDGIALSFEEPKWMGERWVACLMPEIGKLIWGRFTSVDLKAKTCRFLPDAGEETSGIKLGSDCKYIDGYWGERIEIVFAPTTQWKRTEFAPRDAVHHYTDGTTKVIPKGWDHEHCAICWETVTNFKGAGAKNFGYKNEKNQWICENCFTSFVEPKRLDFITEPQPTNPPYSSPRETQGSKR